MRHPDISRFALALAACLASLGLRAQDLDQNPAWLALKPVLFGDRPVQPNAANILQVFAPQRAEDAAVVPVTIRARIEQRPERYIRHIYLVIDENPSPFGVKFTLTPQSGRADIETRVRLQSSSPVRAVAELDDGTLWMHSTMVYGAGGCSAPVADGGAAPNLGRMKLLTEVDIAARGEPVLAQLMIQHPQHSGMATNVTVPPHFVREVRVYYADVLVLTAELDFTISENPNFRFYFLPLDDGRLRAEVVDSSDLRFDQTLAVRAPR